MTDVVDRATRRKMMSGIRAKNTNPEIRVRRILFALGYRYRLHVRKLPGTPDIVLPKHHAVVFVHGCFWHRHDCKLFKMPKSNVLFWRRKLNRNRDLDKLSEARLLTQGWRVATIWECALKGTGALKDPEVQRLLDNWLRSDERRLLIRGT